MSERRFDALDKQWVMLMFLAKQSGITVDEVKHFFQASAGRVTENTHAPTPYGDISNRPHVTSARSEKMK